MFCVWVDESVLVGSLVCHSVLSTATGRPVLQVVMEIRENLYDSTVQHFTDLQNTPVP
jgi:hypothetical protein